MQCPKCGYMMSPLDKECPRCKLAAESQQNPYVAHQERQAQERRAAMAAATPAVEDAATPPPHPAHSAPTTYETLPPGTSAPRSLPRPLLLLLGIAVALVSILLYHFLVVRPQIAALRDQIASLSQATDHNATILDKHTRALADLGDTVDNNANVANQNAATANENAALNSRY